jgi:ABC-2 type transport system ATP-binding protein
MVTIKNFSKTYAGEKKAVKNLNLEIKAGDIYGFIGHNGAGKTTTIKAIAGILEFEQGEILIDGHSIITDDVECKSKIAYIPDNPDIYEHLTGIEYLNFIANIFSIEKKTREDRIKYYAKEFEIFSNLGDLIASYSHGMKQKLVIISALIHKPKLLLLDEPFVGLDPVATLKLKKIMYQI